MEQSPSWEANRSSAGQEISLILWNSKVRRRIHNSPLPVSTLSRFNSFPKPLCMIGNMFSFLLWGVVSTSPTLKLEDHPLPALRYCLFTIFAAILHIWRPFLHPQPEDAPCRGDRDPFTTVRHTWGIKKYNSKLLYKTKNGRGMYCHLAQHSECCGFL